MGRQTATCSLAEIERVKSAPRQHQAQVIAQGPPRLLVGGLGDALATWFEARTCVAGHVKNMRAGASTRSALVLADLCC
jgi:glycerol dehydrogenase-like iron-containing ADH family enzyme